jgi:tetratricopeptide (TPR) repeat protein
MNFTHIKHALSVNPADPGQSVSEAITEIEELYYDGNYEEAEAYTNTLLKITTTHLGEYNDHLQDLLQIRGDIYLETDRYNKAEQDYLKILKSPVISRKLMPYQHVELNYKLGKVAYKQENYRKAITLLDKANILHKGLERHYPWLNTKIEILRSYVLVELGQIQKGWEVFLSNIYTKSTGPIEELMGFIDPHLTFAEHLNNVGDTKQAKHFTASGIRYALDYHKRISEFLVRAFRDLSGYYQPTDLEKSVALMMKSGEIFKNMVVVQSYSPAGADPA